MLRLNYHHLHYFWAVAKEGHLTRAAEHLHVSQSALSAQIRQLEEQLGQALFERRGRTLVLTESGRLALAYADTIFASGAELVSLLRDGRRDARQVLRIGAPVLDPLTCGAPSRAARWLDDPAGLEALLRAIEDVGLSERGD